MTKSINPPPNPDPQQPGRLRRLLNQLKSSPKKVAGGIVAIAALGSLGYWGLQALVKKQLPPLAESQIGKIIERPLDLGEVKSVSLKGIEFGQTVIPSTAIDTDRVTVEEIKIGFNLLPVLFRRTLPLDVTLVQPDVYLEQTQDGEWLNLDFLQKDPNEPEKDPLIYFDVDLDVQEADITAVPYQQDSLQARVDGTGKFHQKKEFLAYDLDASIEAAKAKIQGETKLETGSTDTKLLVNNLELADAATLLPIPLTIDRGVLNADLDINIPSFAEFDTGNVTGKVNLQDLVGEATALDAPLTAESRLNFSGRNAEVEQTQATLGDITAQVDGAVSLDTGYDLALNLLPFQLASLPDNLAQQLPVDLAGEVEAQVKVRGEIKDPQLTGKLNNTQTIVVDRTPLNKVGANFRADLDRVVLEDVQILPGAGGKVMAEGTITTNLRQTLSEPQSIEVAKMPLALSFTADLPTEELVSPYYQLPQQVEVGNLNARGQIDGTLENPQGLVKFDLADSDGDTPEAIAGSGELVIAEKNLTLRDTQINYGDGVIDVAANANLDSQQWQTNLQANALNLRPFAAQLSNNQLNLNLPLALNNVRADFNGSLERMSLEQIDGTAKLDLDVNGGRVAVDSQLNNGNLRATASTSNIKLDSLVTSLPVAAALESGSIEAMGKLKQLLAVKDNPQLNTLKANADLDLIVDGAAVVVNSQIDSGKIQARANTGQLDLNRLAPSLPIPANLRRSQITATGEIQQLLNLAENPNLSTVDARVDADLLVAAGTVKAIANLQNNRWRGEVNANNVSSQLLLEQFAPQNLAALELENIDARGNLSGSIEPLIANEVNLPIEVETVTVNSGEQNLTARGDLTLANLTSNFDIAETNLDIAANLDFDRLPIDGLVAGATQNNELIAESVNVGGKAAFNGRLAGQQLLSAPAENVSLTGDLKLQNFAFNEIKFDPEMAGTLTLQPRQELALRLQGEEDIIAAIAVPCNTDDCKLPYLPTNLELRQGETTDRPVIALGERNGDRFNLNINNFPLALLNLAPGRTAGIEGALEGTTTGEIELDLYTLAASGDIQIVEPGLGYIQADRLQADFNYNPENNIAAIDSASLELDRSQYDLNAALDLESGEIDGKLNIPQAYIQDLLTTLRWFTIEDAANLFNIPNYGSTRAVKPSSERDTVDKSIARRLNQLRQVNNQIQANASLKESGSVPTELDIQGKYAGEVILNGTIQVPQADFRVTGNNWQWQPRPAYPDIVSPLGLIIEESQSIALPKLLVAGNLNGTTVNLAEARLEVQEAVFSLEGKLSPEESDAEFAVANLTVDNISNFVEIPVYLAGEINSEGTIRGTIEQPELAGTVAFVDGAFNGNVLPAELAGDFNYDGSKLNFNTTAPQSIQVEASLPYPIIPGQSDRFTASANLESEAFVFLAALSQNYLNWIGGDGDARLEASARLDLDREGIIYDLAADGVVNLDNANVTVDTPFFTEVFAGTGKITLNNQIVNVETLNATFAEKELLIAGKLPILSSVIGLEQPLTVDLPDAGKIKIDKLYEGGVDGQVTIKGTSLQPVIGGEVNLYKGKISIPQADTSTPEDAIQIARAQTLDTVSGAASSTSVRQSANAEDGSFITTLNDLQINLEEFKLQQSPLYSFQLEGGLRLNGTVDEPTNIIPQGTLVLNKADVDLFSTEFNLVRNRENAIVFSPEAGVFNPRLDIILRTSVEDLGTAEVSDLRSVESSSNAIDDPVSNGNDSQTVRVSLVIDGEAQEILPNLGRTQVSGCNIRPNNQPLVENERYYTAAELDQYTQCFASGFSVSSSDRNLLESSAVELTSTPSLNQGEILGLLSNQFVGFARDVSSSSQSELFDLGVQRFVITPLLDGAIDRVDDITVGLGRKISLDYLTVYPDLEGIYELNQDSSLRFVYTHNLFQRAIEAINGTGEREESASSEVRLEYQRNF
ncbi:MAG: translocation/assembly module TamB domain-containing protein [Cyanobacteria bacterium J06623_7]